MKGVYERFLEKINLCAKKDGPEMWINFSYDNTVRRAG